MKSKSDRMTLFAAGDFYGSGRPAQMNPEELFSELDPVLDGCDLRILNFEMPLGKARTPIVKSGPALISHPGIVNLLKGRFEVALLANNHILDYGGNALLRTMKILAAAGIRTAGAGRNRSQAESPLEISRNGFDLSIINICENEFSLAYGTSPGAAGIHVHRVFSLIREQRKKNKVVLVFTHGGNEFNPVPSPRVVSMNRLFADAGAAAIVNSHPHIPQGIERWNGVPIAYSLGNFVFDQLEGMGPVPDFWWVGMPVKIILTKTQNTVKAEMEPVPILLNPATARLELLKGRAHLRFMKWLKEVGAAVKNERLLKKCFEAWASEWGKGYFQHMACYNSNLNDGDGAKAFACFRNLWCCEAHNELLATYVELLFRGRLDQARKFLPAIRKWQAGIGTPLRPAECRTSPTTGRSDPSSRIHARSPGS